MTAASPLPVISLWQPFASLIFCGAKRHETRKRMPPPHYVGKTIGIQATLKFTPRRFITNELHSLCMEHFGCQYHETLPRGSILGTVRLVQGYSTAGTFPVDDDDRLAGDWGAGRFAWLLANVREFKAPIVATGGQGWWFYRGELPR